MKVIKRLLILLFLLLFTGCSNSEVKVNSQKEVVATNDDMVIEIKEKMFIAQLDDVFTNSNDYIGRTIKIEGFYDPLETDGRTINYVSRRSPGCCGNDGIACIEFIGDKKMPKPNDWIEVIGKIEEYEDESGKSVRIRLGTLNVKTERGAEFVSQ